MGSKPAKAGSHPGFERGAEFRIDALAAAEGLAPFDQRIFTSLWRGHRLEKHAFAQAKCRQDDALDAQRLDQPLEHGGGVGQGVQAPLGDAFNLVQRAR